MREIPKRYVRPIPLPRPEDKPGDHPATLFSPNGSRPTPELKRMVADNANGPWERLGVALFWAGGGYPLLLWVLSIPFVVVGVLVDALSGDPESYFYVVLIPATMLLAALVAGFFLLFYVGVVLIFGLVAVGSVLSLLRVRIRWEALGAFSGSWIAFLCFLPLTVDIRFDRLANMLPLILLGPVLATAWGMLVGAYAGIGAQRRISRGVRAGAGVRFSILQFMMLTLVVSVVLAVLRAAQLLNSTLLLSVGVWLGCFLAFYWPATRLARCLYRRRARRYLRYRSRRRVTSRQAASEVELRQP